METIIERQWYGRGFLGKVRVKKGLWSMRNVNEEVHSMVANYIRENMGTYEEAVTNDFNLDDTEVSEIYIH